MARPHGGYRDAAGKRIPGVTTISKLIDDPGGLIHWAWDCGINGIDYRDARDSAAGYGTRIHSLVEEWAEQPDTAAVDEPEEVRVGFEAFLEWAMQTKLSIIEHETSLVSEKLRVGGTLDAIAYCGGKMSLIDWKTGSGIYPAVVLQLAAYRELVREHTPEDEIEAAHVIRFNRESGAFAHTLIPSHVLDQGWEAFKYARALYDLRAKLKKSL